METNNIIPESSITTAINIGVLLRNTLAEFSDDKMSHRGHQILEFVVEQYLAKRQVRMEDVMGLKHLGSRYTNRKYIQSLINDGFITIESNEDGRLHPVVPTEKALHLFVVIANRIQKVASRLL